MSGRFSLSLSLAIYLHRTQTPVPSKRPRFLRFAWRPYMFRRYPSQRLECELSPTPMDALRPQRVSEWWWGWPTKRATTTTTYRKVHGKHGGASAQCHRLKQTGFDIRHVVARTPSSTIAPTTTRAWTLLSVDSMDVFEAEDSVFARRQKANNGRGRERTYRRCCSWRL